MAEAAGYSVERVGMQMSLGAVAVENASGDVGAFTKCVAAVKGATGLPLILMSKNPAAIDAALQAGAGARPLIYAADAENWQAMAEVAKKSGAPLAVRSKGSLEDLAALCHDIAAMGVQDLVLDPGVYDLAGSLAAVHPASAPRYQEELPPAGLSRSSASPVKARSRWSRRRSPRPRHIAKYAGVVVLDHFSPEVVYPLLTLRLNVYTDPQKPIQVAPGVYQFNEPGPNSPVLITTNFSLTYFSVAGEIEASGVPTWLVISDSEGLSVLTAWAAGKFTSESIAKTMKTCGIADKVQRKVMTLPRHGGHPLRRAGGGAAGLEDRRRPARGGRHPGISRRHNRDSRVMSDE